MKIPANTSSRTIPQPPGISRSIFRMGKGLKISKRRKIKKPPITENQAKGNPADRSQVADDFVRYYPGGVLLAPDPGSPTGYVNSRQN